MMMFVWENVHEGLTAHFHSGGGILAISDSLDSAIEMVLEYSKKNNQLEEAIDKEKLGAPDFSAVVKENVPRLFIFPDVGCC